MRAESQFICEISGDISSPRFSLPPRSRIDRIPAVYLTNFLLARRRGVSKKSISRLARETDLSREKKGNEQGGKDGKKPKTSQGEEPLLYPIPLASSRSFVRGPSEIKPGKTPKARIAAFLR